MDIRVSWRNQTHFMLREATVTLTVDGVDARLPPPTVGVVTGPIPAGSTAVLTVEFLPTFTGRAVSVLRIVQEFDLALAGPLPTKFRVRDPAGGPDVERRILNPLLHSWPDSAGVWQVTVDTSLVEVAGLQPLTRAVDGTGAAPLILRPFEVMRTSGPQASVRILARTDGKRPLHYICATPLACRSANFTDVLGFLTPPQRSVASLDSDEGLMDPRLFAKLAERVRDFLGRPRHDDTLPQRDRDHFNRAPADEVPNAVLDRNWEEALTASGRHVALVLPVPSRGSHNTAATGDLPVQLRQAHAALVALGDIGPPTGIQLTSPLLGAAAHSNGGPSLLEALRLSAETAFAEAWLFEAKTVEENIEILARTSGTRILFAGYERSSVIKSHAAALAHPKLGRGRVDRLPDPPPSPDATPAELADGNASFAHMLEGIVTPARAWRPPRRLVLRSGELYRERFAFLHQLIVQGRDGDGQHFLTKALRRSGLR